MFNNIEERFMFKDDLDYEFEEYEPNIDNVQDIESDFPTLEEFTTNTQIAESHTSRFLPMDQQLSVISNHNEGCACVFVESRDKVTFQIIEDPYTNFLQSTGMIYFLAFTNHEDIFSGQSEFPTFCLIIPTRGK